MAQKIINGNSGCTDFQSGCHLKYDKDILPALNDAFCCFEDMVRKCIQAKNETVLGRRFEEKARIEFPQFRAMWNEHHGRDAQAKKEYGLELSWHVIRSFIKGWDWEKYLTPEDYGDSTQVGPDEKDVTDKTFKLVFDKVWSQWYSKIGREGEEKWDDLDLIRYCLHPDDGSVSTCIPDKKYAAVFCDEAQDFTRVQTEFILRLSVFTEKRLKPEDAEKLPFVFVGDEAQTLNPTGFSWNSLRSYAYTRLCAMLGFERFTQSPAPLTLRRNYRSTLPIVKLGNAIQLLRHVRLGKANSDFEPQVSHDPDPDVQPVYCLNPADPAVWVYLKTHKATVIIPGGDGQSAKDFLDKTVVGEKGLVEFTDNGISKDLTILNAMQAKELERDFVAVYGFDEASQLPPELSGRELSAWLASGKEPDSISQGQAIALKYFLNNAYVAVTRARKQLVILSNCRNPDTFWFFAYSDTPENGKEVANQIETALVSRLSQTDGEVQLGPILPGGVDSLRASGVVDLKTDAESLADYAKNRGDPNIMLQASQRYKEAGLEEESTVCLAWACMYEGKYEEAAKWFAGIRDSQHAITAYWLALDAESAGRVLPKLAEFKFSQSARPEVQAASCLLEEAPLTLAKFGGILDKLAGLANADGEEAKRDFYAAQYAWEYALARLLEKLPRVNQRDAANIDRILTRLEDLQANGVSIPLEQMSHLAFQVRQYKKVVEMWERKKTPDWLRGKDAPAEYWNAKAGLPGESYDNRVKYRKWSHDSEWAKAVREEFRNEGDRFPEDHEAHSIVTEALLSAGWLHREKAREYAAWLLAHASSLQQGNTWIDLAFGTSSPDSAPFSRTSAEALLKTKLGMDIADGAARDRNLVRVLQKISHVSRGGLRNALAVAKGEADTVAIGMVKDETKNPWFPYLAMAVGNVLEQRGFYRDSLRYYEWILKNATLDGSSRRLMDARWVFNKFHLNRINPSRDSSLDIDKKLKELGLASTDGLSDTVQLDWVKFFADVFEKIQADPVRENGIDHEPSEPGNAPEKSPGDESQDGEPDGGEVNQPIEDIPAPDKPLSGEPTPAHGPESALPPDGESSPESAPDLEKKTVQEKVDPTQDRAAYEEMAERLQEAPLATTSFGDFRIRHGIRISLGDWLGLHPEFKQVNKRHDGVMRTFAIWAANENVDAYWEKAVGGGKTGKQPDAKAFGIYDDSRRNALGFALPVLKAARKEWGKELGDIPLQGTSKDYPEFPYSRVKPTSFLRFCP